MAMDILPRSNDVTLALCRFSDRCADFVTDSWDRERISINKANVTRVTNGLGVNGPTDNSAGLRGRTLVTATYKYPLHTSFSPNL